MIGIKKMLTLVLNQDAFKKIVVYLLLIIVLYVLREFLSIFLLTFIFGFLFFSTSKFLKRKTIILGNKIKFFRIITKIPLWLIIILEYILFIGIIIYASANIIPTIKSEVNSIVEEFSIINSYDKNLGNLKIIEGENIDNKKSGSVQIIIALDDFKNSILQKLVLIDPEDNLNIIEKVENFGKDIDFKSFQTKIFNILGTIGHSLLNIISALILSFIFIVDRKKMSAYLFKIKESNFGFLYSEYKILFDKIIKSFGLILKAQSMVAFANATITIIGLLIVGFVFSTPDVPTFPYILTLGLIVFIFGFVPVLGVILSSIPIMVIGYITYGDFMIIPIIVLLITIVHIIEAYYLNPKIVSSFLKLPMSLTFVILLVSGKMLGIAGLLIGISIFYFSMGLLKDFDSMIGKNKKKIEKNKIFTKGKKTIK